jgi:hypothetical protein
MVFDTAALGITNVSVDLGGKLYPQRQYQPNWTTGANCRRVYEDYLSACENSGLADRSDVCLDYRSFMELYPMFCIDTSASDQSAYSNQGQVEVTINFDKTVGTDAKLLTVCKMERTVILSGSNGNTLSMANVSALN